MNQHLVLAAEDAADLEVISARLQDAVGQLKDFGYLPKKRRFAALFNRFEWELPERGRQGGNLRVRAVLHFDSVISVKSHKIKLGAPDAVVSLLAISFKPNGVDDPAGTVELLFSGGGIIRLEVECVDAGLQDVGSAWAARGRPEHETES
jgi:hypothetical protein